MTTYYLIDRNELFAIAYDRANDALVGVCGPLDSSDYPTPGDAIDLRGWSYDSGDGRDSLMPYDLAVALLAVQEDGELIAEWLIDADE